MRAKSLFKAMGMFKSTLASEPSYRPPAASPIWSRIIDVISPVLQNQLADAKKYASKFEDRKAKETFNELIDFFNLLPSRDDFRNLLFDAYSGYGKVLARGFPEERAEAVDMLKKALAIKSDNTDIRSLLNGLELDMSQDPKLFIFLPDDLEEDESKKLK